MIEIKEEFLPGFEPNDKKDIEIKYPEENERIICNYCEDVGPCEYCERGREEIRRILENKKNEK